MLAQYPVHYTMLLMVLMNLLKNIHHSSKMNIGRKAITILLQMVVLMM